MTFNPRKLLLIDGLGALLSALLLGVGLVRLEYYIGMPVKVLYPLAGLAAVFAAYSLLCFLFVDKNRPTALRVIAWANLAYCCLTGALVLVYRKELTGLGYLYFAAEVAVIAALASIELKVAAWGSRSCK